MNDINNTTKNTKNTICKCNNKMGCLLCDKIATTNIYRSSSTNRVYEALFPNDVIKVDCDTVNCIYMITCSKSNLQYVGETAQSLKRRFAKHREGLKHPERDNTCRILSQHFNSPLCKNASYTINILEKLSGDGRNEKGILDSNITKMRRQKETNDMLKLRTVYPYGLNDRIGNEYRSVANAPIGSYFPTLKRHSNYGNRTRRTSIDDFNIAFFIKNIDMALNKNIKIGMNYIRTLLTSLKKSNLKKVGVIINDYLMRQGEKFPFLPWYLSALDIIETKIFKTPVNRSKKKPPDSIISSIFTIKGSIL